MDDRLKRGLRTAACLLIGGALAVAASAVGVRSIPDAWKSYTRVATKTREATYTAADGRRRSITAVFGSTPIVGLAHTGEIVTIQLTDDSPSRPSDPRPDADRFPTRDEAMARVQSAFDEFIAPVLPAAEPTDPPVSAVFALAQQSPDRSVAVEFPRRKQREAIVQAAGYVGFLGIGLILMAIAQGLWSYFQWERHMRELPPAGCPNCGYSLIGIEGERCPECGARQW